MAIFSLWADELAWQGRFDLHHDETIMDNGAAIAKIMREDGDDNDQGR